MVGQQSIARAASDGNTAGAARKAGYGRGVEASPRFVQIEPVGECNLRCRMCPVRYREARGAFMPWETYAALVDALPALTEMHLQGLGEPLLHPRFFDMVSYAAGRGVRVSVNTNLTLLTPAKAERIVTCGLGWIYVSADGATPATYERIRVDASWEKFSRNVVRLMAAIERHGGPEVTLTAVAMRDNLDELAGLVERAAEWGIRTLNVQHLCHDFGESTLPARYAPMRAFVAEQTLLAEDPARVAHAFAAARDAAAQHGVALRLPRVVPVAHAPGTPGRARCDWPWRGPYVAYDGTAMPCCMIATPDRGALGNVRDAGVEAVWNGAAYADFRRRLDSDDPPEVCRSCSVYARVF
ncbi:MAG: radical SAM protein [Candidatus Eremiobacteraeota bacterium]|nr:radical SAM protein [Candidatus Eremiobacteraeota bacterium]